MTKEGTDATFAPELLGGVPEAFVHTALLAGGVGLWEWPIAGDRVTLSPYLETLLGYPPGGFDSTKTAFLGAARAARPAALRAFACRRDRTCRRVRCRVSRVRRSRRVPTFRREGARHARLVGRGGPRRRHDAGDSRLLSSPKGGCAGSRVRCSRWSPASATAACPSTTRSRASRRWRAPRSMSSAPAYGCSRRIARSSSAGVSTDEASAVRWPALISTSAHFLPTSARSSRIARWTPPTHRHDPRTRELTEGYLVPLGITSMLEATVRMDTGELVGVVCHEHVGPDPPVAAR